MKSNDKHKKDLYSIQKSLIETAKKMKHVAVSREKKGDLSDSSSHGSFGEFGGCYVPENLHPSLEELELTYIKMIAKKSFRNELKELQHHYVGRPSVLTFASRLSQAWGVKVYLKREDLNYTGSHKINSAIGHALLARATGKRRLVSEDASGHHGVALASVARLFGFSCTIYMGSEDVRRGVHNYRRMKTLGAEVISVTSGAGTLRDALNCAMRDWALHSKESYYAASSVIGPHPFPTMVRDFQTIIGREARKQIRHHSGKSADAVFACAGGGSAAAGIFYGFLDDRSVKLFGVRSGSVSDSSLVRRAGYFHGTRSMFIQDAQGTLTDIKSIAPGLTYPGTGPEHAYWESAGRVEYRSVVDTSAMDAFREVVESEGILPDLESAHAFASAKQESASMKSGSVILICVSGRGDKDMATENPL